jgi:MFS family permease
VQWLDDAVSMLALARDKKTTSWAERGVTAGVFLGFGLGVGAWASSIPYFKARLGLSDGELSFALVSLMAGSIVSMPVMGPLAARIGSGRSLRSLALAYPLTMLLPRLADSLPMLMAATFAIGLGNGAMDVVMNTHASDIERRWKVPIMSSFHAGYSLGGLLGAALGGLLAARGLIVDALPVATAICVLIAALSWTSVGRGAVAKGGGSGLALPNLAVLPLCMLCLLCLLCEGAMADWSAVYLSTVVGTGPALAAAGFAGFSAAMILGRLTGDAVTNRFGRRPVVRVGAALATIGLALAAAVPTSSAAIIGFALVGMGLANVVPLTFGAAGRLAGLSPARGIAMVATAGYTGFLMGPPLVGGVASLVGLRSGMALVAICAAAALLLAGPAFRGGTE